jgi:hypothetical protein
MKTTEESPTGFRDGTVPNVDADRLAEAMRALKLYWQTPPNANGEELRLERASRALAELVLAGKG